MKKSSTVRVLLPILLRLAARCCTGAGAESAVLRLAARRRTGAAVQTFVSTPERVLTILFMSISGVRRASRRRVGLTCFCVAVIFFERKRFVLWQLLCERVGGCLSEGKKEKKKRKRGRGKGIRRVRKDIRVELSLRPACVCSYLLSGYNGQSLGWLQWVLKKRETRMNRRREEVVDVGSPPARAIVACWNATAVFPARAPRVNGTQEQAAGKCGIA